MDWKCREEGITVADITLGQYYKVDSCIHRLDARVKLFCVFSYMILLFFCNHILGFAAAIMALASVILCSKVPVAFIMRGLKSILFLLLFSMVINGFCVPGEILWEWRFLRLTREGIYYAVVIGIRLVLLVLASSMLTLTTTPMALCDGLEKGLGFLKRVGIPVHETAMMISIALRFIPILMEETNKIMKAQTARGASFHEGSLWKKLMSMLPLLIPLFISAIRRAGELANAMEARCYRGGEGRSKMYPLEYKSRDYIGYIMLVIYGAVILFIWYRYK